MITLSDVNETRAYVIVLKLDLLAYSSLECGNVYVTHSSY